MRSIVDSACWIDRYPPSADDSGVPPGQVGDGPHGAQTVPADGPQHVAQGDRLGARPLQLLGVEHGGGQLGVDVGGVRVELVEPGRDRREQLVVIGQRQHAGQPAQGLVDDPRRGGDGAGITADRERRIEAVEQLGPRRRRTGRRTADDADDAAHGCSGY